MSYIEGQRVVWRPPRKLVGRIDKYLEMGGRWFEYWKKEVYENCSLLP